MTDILTLKLTDFQTVIFFLLPGFLTIILFFYQIPDRKKSDLSILTFSVVFSVFLSYISALFFGLINLITNLRSDLKNEGFGYDITRIILGVLLALLLAKFVRSKLFVRVNEKVFKINVFPFGRLWNNFLNLPPNTILKIFLNNGMTYVGIIKHFSIDPDDDNQEIELASPFYYDSKTGNLSPIKETETVLINRSAIIGIEKISNKEFKKIYK